MNFGPSYPCGECHYSTGFHPKGGCGLKSGFHTRGESVSKHGLAFGRLLVAKPDSLSVSLDTHVIEKPEAGPMKKYRIEVLIRDPDRFLPVGEIHGWARIDSPNHKAALMMQPG